jgi:hypothetical protein
MKEIVRIYKINNKIIFIKNEFCENEHNWVNSQARRRETYKKQQKAGS